MNPFTESTVARPLGRAGRPHRISITTQNRLRRVVRAFRGGGLAASLGLAACLAMPGAALAVNVNAATQAQLQAVRGIGPKTARIIIEERLRGGRYESIEDLSDRVKGIGPKKAAALRAAGLTVQEPGRAGPLE